MIVPLLPSLKWPYSHFVGVNLYQRLVKCVYNDGNHSDLLFNSTSSYQFLISVLLQTIFLHGHSPSRDSCVLGGLLSPLYQRQNDKFAQKMWQRPIIEFILSTKLRTSFPYRSCLPGLQLQCVCLPDKHITALTVK